MFSWHVCKECEMTQSKKLCHLLVNVDCRVEANWCLVLSPLTLHRQMTGESQATPWGPEAGVSIWVLWCWIGFLEWVGMLSIHSVNVPQVLFPSFVDNTRNLYCCQSINLLSKQVKSKYKAERNLYTTQSDVLKIKRKRTAWTCFPMMRAWAWSHTLGLRLSSLSLRFAFNEPEKPGGPGLGMQLLRILRVRNVSANERRAALLLTNHSHRQSSSLQVKEGRKWEDLIAFQHSSSQV